jgi:hypothetical protein
MEGNSFRILKSKTAKRNTTPDFIRLWRMKFTPSVAFGDLKKTPSQREGVSR